MVWTRLSTWLHQRRMNRLTLEYARERVQRGARYLDQMHSGWYRRVDADTLALHDGQACVLGQLHGDYRAGLSRSSLLNFGSAPRLSLSPIDHGFQAVQGLGEDAEATDYELLDIAWQEAVRTRQEADTDVQVLALA